MEAYSLLLTQRKGKDSKSPNTQPTSTVRPIRNPPRTRGAISALLEASPPRPSTTHRSSASLEATPRQTELAIRRLTVRLTEAINANHSTAEWEVRRRQATTPHNGCDWNPIRQLRSLLSQPRH